MTRSHWLTIHRTGWSGFNGRDIFQNQIQISDHEIFKTYFMSVYDGIIIHETFYFRKFSKFVYSIHRCMCVYPLEGSQARINVLLLNLKHKIWNIFPHKKWHIQMKWYRTTETNEWTKNKIRIYSPFAIIRRRKSAGK